MRQRPNLTLQLLTECHPGFDAGDLGVGDVLLDKSRFAGLLQQVPHLNSSVLFSNVEDGRSRRGPACRRAHLLRVWRQYDGTFLDVGSFWNREIFFLDGNSCGECASRYQDILPPDGEVGVAKRQNSVLQEGRALHRVDQPMVDTETPKGLWSCERNEWQRRVVNQAAGKQLHKNEWDLESND